MSEMPGWFMKSAIITSDLPRSAAAIAWSIALPLYSHEPDARAVAASLPPLT